MEKKSWLVLVVVVVVCAFGVQAGRTAVNNSIAKRTQEMQEEEAKKIADYKLECENSKIQLEKELKQKNVELQDELQKAKILILKLKKTGEYNKMLKEDVKGFMKRIDELLGIKGKELNDKK